MVWVSEDTICKLQHWQNFLSGQNCYLSKFLHCYTALTGTCGKSCRQHMLSLLHLRLAKLSVSFPCCVRKLLDSMFFVPWSDHSWDLIDAKFHCTLSCWMYATSTWQQCVSWLQYAVFAVGDFIYYGPDNFGAFANPDSAEQLVSDRRQFCLMLGHDGCIPWLQHGLSDSSGHLSGVYLQAQQLQIQTCPGWKKRQSFVWTS